MSKTPGPMAQPLAAVWASYRNDVLPPAATEAHVREAKIAFYAGFHTAFWMLSNNPSETSMQGWSEEINLFIEQAKGGLV